MTRSCLCTKCPVSLLCCVNETWKVEVCRHNRKLTGRCSGVDDWAYFNLWENIGSLPRVPEGCPKEEMCSVPPVYRTENGHVAFCETVCDMRHVITEFAPE
jgi:hypothetical protein